MPDIVSKRALLAEDDPVSQTFLRQALRDAGLEVFAVDDGSAALATAREQRFDVLILDHHLPGRNGDEVLRALHSDELAASSHAVAIATTAEPDPAVHTSLHDAGFAKVLVKPTDTPTLHRVLRALGIVDRNHSYALDDAAGLAASGSTESLSALRGMFARELDGLSRELEGVRDNDATLHERLHKLRAACGFCGAAALAAAASNLSSALHDADRALIDAAWITFIDVVQATKLALANTQS